MAHGLDAVCDGIAKVGDIGDEFCGSQQDVNMVERGRCFSIARGLERSIKPIDSLTSKYLRLNSARLQLASSHGPTAQLNVWSVQMQVMFVREQPLKARAGAIQGDWEKKMSEEVIEAVSG